MACARTQARWAVPVHWKTLHMPAGEAFPRGWMDSAGPRFETALAREAPECQALVLDIGESVDVDTGVHLSGPHTLRGIRARRRHLRLAAERNRRARGGWTCRRRTRPPTTGTSPTSGSPSSSRGTGTFGTTSSARRCRWRRRSTGAAFEFQASLHGLRLRRGGYVTLESDAGARLGQITDLSSRTIEAAVASGEGGTSDRAGAARGGQRHGPRCRGAVPRRAHPARDAGRGPHLVRRHPPAAGER